MLARLAFAALLVAGCEASQPSSSEEEALTCDVGGASSLENACVKASQPESNQTALPLSTSNQDLSGVNANVYAWGVHLSNVSGHYEGVVGFDPPENGTYEIYLSSNPPFRVVDETTGSTITASCASSISSTECSSLRHVGTYALTQGHSVRLEFGPTTVSYVRLHIQTRMPTPAVCTAGELTEETAACDATSAETPLTANTLATIGFTSRVELAPGTVYGVKLPAVTGGYGGWVYMNVSGTVELYLGTPNIPLRIFNYNDFNDTHTPLTECSRYIPSTECSKLRRGTRLTGGMYRIEFGPSSSSYVRVELRTVTAPHGTVKLAPARVFTADNASSYVTAGDLDGDGALDLAVSCPDDASGETYVDTLKGDGSGAFTFETRNRTNDPAETVIADFDRDGTADIAGVDWDGMGPLGAFYLRGTGNFTYTRNTWGNGLDYLTTVSSGDFDGDGTPELVVPWTDSQNPTSTLGGFVIAKPATNTILQNEPGFGNDTAGAVAGDFNGDGKQDVITASASSGAAKLYLGNGTGTVTFASDFTLPAGGIWRLFAFDLDRDGKSDLVATAANGTTISYGTAMGMAAPKTLDITRFSVAAGDFDHDGRIDLAFGHDRFAQTTDITFYLATDAGFENAGTISAPTGVGYSFATGDFNGDGFTDLAVPGAQSVQIFLSTP